MAKPKHDWEQMPLRLPTGTFARVQEVLRDGEDRTTLTRKLLLDEIARREREKARKERGS